MRFRWNKQIGIPVITGVSCLVAGTGVGYFIANARLSKKVREIEANQKKLREHFESITQKSKDAPVAESDPEDGETMQHTRMIDEIVERVQEPGLPQVEDSTPDLEINEGDEFLRPAGYIIDESRIFAPLPDDDWDYEVEVPKRGDTNPYIIHRDEYFAEESGFRQSSLTYYSGDNILCDEKEQPIYNHDLLVGHGNLRFGHGSLDQSIVYVRNPLLQSEFEIILDDGHYQVEVLGAVIEDEMNENDLKHTIHRYHKD